MAASGIPGRLRDNPQEFARFTRPLTEDDKLRHALDRLTLGSRPGDLARLKAIGLKHWLNGQLHPETLPENPELNQKLAPLEVLRLSSQDAYVRYPPARRTFAASGGGTSTGPDDSDPEPKTLPTKALSSVQIQTLQTGTSEEKRELLASIPPGEYSEFIGELPRRQRRALFPLAPVGLRRQLMLAVNPQLVVASDLTEAKILRAVYSTRQLQELLVDFWYNHFNVFLNKGADHYLVPSYERDAIRPYVFGKFYDLLLATAESPAMLFYLDNWQSVGVDTAPFRQAKNRHGLNENYGRELLELHTIGVGAGYTQQDVIEVARCFTGWTITNPRRSGVFEYNDRMHDKGRKLVLGHVIEAGGGMNDGLEVLSLLAHHPSTARFISLKLAQRFVADVPPPSLVNRMAAAFLAHDGDLREVTRAMINSPEFWSEGAFRAKIKTPFEMVVSAVRASQADVKSAFLLSNEIQKLGEPLYRKIEPTGYSSANAEWVSSASLLERMNFAIALAHNRVPGVYVDTSSWEIDTKDPLRLARSLLDADISVSSKQAIEKVIDNPELQEQLAAGLKTGPPHLSSLIAGLTLGSPEFQRR